MGQQRDAPAFQEYAASMMARTAYRVMSMEARGLLYTLRLECWVNGSLPADPATLARVLAYPVEQLERTLPEVSALFTFCDGVIRCPELDDYRAHLEERRQRQAAGGRAGAAKTNGARPQGSASKPAGKPRVTREPLVQNSQGKNSQEKNKHADSVGGEGDMQQWVNDYERASRGH